MTDVLLPRQRSYCMSRIRGKNTKPEMVVRRMAHAMGYRFRLHRRDLPGTPDLVFPRLRAVVFVHGCFWHIHRCRFGRVEPKANRVFWRTKREGNRRRDRQRGGQLKRQGWRVLTIWECELREPDRVAQRLDSFLKAAAFFAPH